MPALAEVDLYNLALSHVGNSTEVQSTTENTAEANACRRYFAQARDEMLEAFPWPFATVTVAAALVEECPTPEWAFAYRYPQDCLTLRRILPYARVEVSGMRVPYKIARDAQGILIYTNHPSAVIEYIAQVTDTTQFAPSFAQALGFKLGWYIAPRVTGGDPYKLGDRAFANYERAFGAACDSASNEEQAAPLPPSEFMLARD